MFVKEESFKIQEDMKEYSNMEMLEFLFEDQLKAIEGSIKNITQQKNEL